jgi:hypothetical protein
VLIPVDVDVDSTAALLLVVLRPVDSEATPLCAVLMPVDVDVDSTAALLLVVLRPVDSEATPLCAVLIPVDVEVDNESMFEPKVLATENSWLPFTASVLPAPTRPAATFCTRRSVPAAPTLTTPAAPLLPANEL